jgi:biotin carboxyl carrier protein
MEVEYQNEKFIASMDKPNENQYEIEIDSVAKTLFVAQKPGASVLIGIEGFAVDVASPDRLDYYSEEKSGNSETTEIADSVVKSHLFGKIISIHVKKNQTVDKGDLLLVIESMKSENAVLSHRKGSVAEVVVKVGQQVSDQMPLVYLENI